jgi:hypothetical protein
MHFIPQTPFWNQFDVSVSIFRFQTLSVFMSVFMSVSPLSAHYHSARAAVSKDGSAFLGQHKYWARRVFREASLTLRTLSHSLPSSYMYTQVLTPSRNARVSAQPPKCLAYMYIHVPVCYMYVVEL